MHQRINLLAPSIENIQAHQKDNILPLVPEALESTAESHFFWGIFFAMPRFEGEKWLKMAPPKVPPGARDAEAEAAQARETYPWDQHSDGTWS